MVKQNVDVLGKTMVVNVEWKDVIDYVVGNGSNVVFEKDMDGYKSSVGEHTFTFSQREVVKSIPRLLDTQINVEIVN